MVDCSYGLHPWRDMEPEEKLCRQELDLLRDTFMEFESVTRSTTVPDICDTLFSSSSDCFGQHADENFDCDELLSSFVAGEAGARGRNIRNTEMFVSLREAVVRLGTYFQVRAQCGGDTRLC